MEAEMLGSLMMLASGVVASSPSSASASSRRCSSVRRSGNWAMIRPGQRDVAGLDLHAGLGGVRLDDRQERVRRQQRRLVGVGVDDLGHGFDDSWGFVIDGEIFLDVKIPDWARPPTLAPARSAATLECRWPTRGRAPRPGGARRGSDDHGDDAHHRPEARRRGARHLRAGLLRLRRRPASAAATTSPPGSPSASRSW